MKFFKPARLVFLLLVLIVSFVIGVYIAGIFGAGEGQMMAAAAIVLDWGFLSAVVALIAAIFIVRIIQHKTLVRTNWGLFIILIILYGLIHYRFLERQKTKEANSTLSIKAPIHLVSSGEMNRPKQSTVMGIGFFQPNFYYQPKLNFYGGVNLEKSLDEHIPQDSLVFIQTELGFSTSYAPPWLYPEHMKLDYGIIMFKVLGYGDDFLKVESNKQTKQFHYVDKTQGRFITWPEMLMSVNSIEPIDEAQSIQIKPLKSSSQVLIDFDFLVPLIVEDEWAYVKLVDTSFNELGEAGLNGRIGINF